MIRRLRERHWENPGWGAIVSVALHLVIAAVLFVRLPSLPAPPPAEESISVELVPPPEEKAAEEKLPEEKAAQEEKTAEAPPPPEAPEAKQAQALDPPADKVSLPVLRPVVEFGEKDTGPKDESRDLVRDTVEPMKQPDTETAKESRPSEAAAVEKQTESELPAASELQDLQLPENEGSEPLPAAGGAQTSDAEAVQPDVAAKTDSADKAEAREDQLTEAKRIFSTSVTDDPVARTAMGDLPRGTRVEQLCSTELFAQLKHASPPHSPELLPTFRLSRGTVLDIRRAAFRARSRWYNLSFRCEVDTEATRVVSFAFDVGAEIPRSEWQERGFPAL